MQQGAHRPQPNRTIDRGTRPPRGAKSLLTIGPSRPPRPPTEPPLNKWVSKHVEDGVTHSRVSRLRDTQERRQELADLAGGDQADAYAASLLDQRTA